MSDDRRGFLQLALGRGAPGSVGARSVPDAFDEEMERLRRVDPALVLYDEVDRVPIAIGAPRGIAAGGDGRLWVAGDSCLLLFERGREVRRLALPQAATCVCESRDGGRVYVGLQDRIEVRDPAGVRIDEWRSEGAGSLVTSIAATEDAVFVADAGRRTVEHRDGRGRLVTALGGAPADRGPHFVVPSPYLDVSLGGDGDLWVTNPGRHRLERYSSPGELLEVLGAPGAAIDGFCGCCNPTHVVALPDGRLVTSEKGLPRVKVLDRSGRLEAVVVPPDRLSRAVTGLDLAVDERGRILVLDPVQRAVRVFAGRSEERRNG